MFSIRFHLRLLALGTLVTAIAGCANTGSDSTASASRDLGAAPAALGDASSSSLWTFTPGPAGKGWQPIRKGIAIEATSAGDAMTVSYQRERSKAAGVAFHLDPGACEGLAEIHLRAAATPEQRVHICLTDGQGVVWTFPTVRLGAESADFVVSTKEIRPDPFQNRGKEIPATPNWSDMKMLTVLDISGFMGGAVEACSWRIERVAGEGKEAGR